MTMGYLSCQGTQMVLIISREVQVSLYTFRIKMRLLNRQPDDTDLQIDSKPKETYVLEAEKEE